MAKTNGPGTGGATAPLDPKVADRLLDLLSTDDEFRHLFKDDPRAALIQAGWNPPSDFKSPAIAEASNLATTGSSAMGCYSVSSIAAKDEIAAAREQLKSYLTSALAPTNPHCFEAGKVSGTLKQIKF